MIFSVKNIMIALFLAIVFKTTAQTIIEPKANNSIHELREDGEYLVIPYFIFKPNIQINNVDFSKYEKELYNKYIGRLMDVTWNIKSINITSEGKKIYLKSLSGDLKNIPVSKRKEIKWKVLDDVTELRSVEAIQIEISLDSENQQKYDETIRAIRTTYNQLKQRDYQLKQRAEAERARAEAERNKTGEICFVNPNIFSRKMVLTHKTTQKSYTAIAPEDYTQKETTACLIVPIGSYSCKVYTTFSHSVVEQYDIYISFGKKQTKRLVKNERN